jgi:hypothetical protein
MNAFQREKANMTATDGFIKEARAAYAHGDLSTVQFTQIMRDLGAFEAEISEAIEENSNAK